MPDNELRAQRHRSASLADEGHDFAPALLAAERRAMAIIACCRAMKANSRIPVTIFVHQFESVPSIVVLAVLLPQSPRLASVAGFSGASRHARIRAC
jgi:hypothetical protein